MNAIDALINNYTSLYWISPALIIVGILITNIFLQLLVKKNLDVWIRVTSIIGLGCGIYASLAISQSLPPKADLALFNNLLCMNSWTLNIHLILLITTLLVVLLPIRNKLTKHEQPSKPYSYPQRLLKRVLSTIQSIKGNPLRLALLYNLVKKLLKNTLDRSYARSLFSKSNTNNAEKEGTSIYAFMLVANLLGAYVLVIANHWLIVYLSLGCMAIGASLLIYTHNTNENNMLASTRYLIYSVVASAVMLVGLSYVYGSTGTLTIYHTIPYDSGNELHTFLSILWPIGFFLALSGLLMVSGSFPFQLWVPTVYQPTSFNIVAYLSTVPKVAVIAFMIRLHQLIVLSNPSLKNSLENLWAILAIFTLLVGHLAALQTSDAKKLLAYGTIAQTGSFLSFLVTDTSTYTHLFYYIIAYSIMNIASWLGLHVFTNLTNSTLIKDYTGLGRKFPVSSSCFLASMIALIGLPPTIGFTAKFFLFYKLWERIQNEPNTLLITLFLTNVLGTLFALYYYLKVPYKLFTTSKEPPTASLWPRDIELIHIMQIILTILLIGLFFSLFKIL